MRRRAIWALVGGAALVLAGSAATAIALTSLADEPSGDAASGPEVAFHTVERQDLTDTSTSPGVLDYGDERPLVGALGGTITGLPALNEVVDRGGVLYRLDNSPVVHLIGGLPAWRSFDVSMSDGPDVRQLEDNLRALGFFDDEPDERYDWVTREAVRDWQESLGMPRTGEIGLGRVVFEPGPRRVGAVTAAVGDQVGPGTEILKLTGQERTVAVQLPIADQRLAAMEAPVTVRLPGGNELNGKIGSVGSPTEVPSDSETRLVIPVEIVLDDPAAVGELQRITVSVAFQSAVYEQVLAVPVTALIALPGGGLGVEKQTGNGIVQVPVDTGAFVQGFVQITGDALAEGDRVVVPE